VQDLIGNKNSIKQCFVDRGYRGHGIKDIQVFISGQKRGVTNSIKKLLKRRSAIEPEIGHMKNDGRLREMTSKARWVIC
jgi:IS5 family transposase